jgi:hypothetical protein
MPADAQTATFLAHRNPARVVPKSKVAGFFATQWPNFTPHLTRSSRPVALTKILGLSLGARNSASACKVKRS